MVVISPADILYTIQVIGIDVYPYPTVDGLPPNLDLQVDDLNSP